MPWSSNITLLVEIVDDPDAPVHPGEGGPIEIDLTDPAGAETRAIYKPADGERPLWDFPPGLYRREIACFELASLLGWDLVPPTVEREGPLGVGSLQQFIAADPNDHYFVLLEDERTHEQLRRLALFDVIANSTDRKGGHVLRDRDGRLWAIDNGLSLHAEFKLRTVIWDFAGEHLPSDLVEDLGRVRETGLPKTLTELLDPAECEALLHRIDAVLAAGRFPSDPTGRRHPWPLV